MPISAKIDATDLIDGKNFTFISNNTNKNGKLEMERAAYMLLIFISSIHLLVIFNLLLKIDTNPISNPDRIFTEQ